MEEIHIGYKSNCLTIFAADLKKKKGYFELQYLKQTKKEKCLVEAGATEGCGVLPPLFTTFSTQANPKAPPQRAGIT